MKVPNLLTQRYYALTRVTSQARSRIKFILSYKCHKKPSHIGRKNKTKQELKSFRKDVHVIDKSGVNNLIKYSVDSFLSLLRFPHFGFGWKIYPHL